MFGLCVFCKKLNLTLSFAFSLQLKHFLPQLSVTQIINTAKALLNVPKVTHYSPKYRYFFLILQTWYFFLQLIFSIYRIFITFAERKTTGTNGTDRVTENAKCKMQNRRQTESRGQACLHYAEVRRRKSLQSRVNAQKLFPEGEIGTIYGKGITNKKIKNYGKN